jgi:hypothetical protein
MADVIEANMRAGLSGITGGLVSKMPGTSQTLDGFVKSIDPGGILPPGVVSDVKGFLKLAPGSSPPDGYVVTNDGYIQAAPLPA